MAPGSARCKICDKACFPADPQINLDGSVFHKGCAKCKDCNCQISLSNFSITLCDDDLLLLCKTHYLKRFKEGGSYVGDEKFNKHRRMGGSGGNSADNLVGDSTESQKVSNKELVHKGILNNHENSIAPLDGMSSSMDRGTNGTKTDQGTEYVMMTTDGTEHSETESSSSSKDAIGRPPTTSTITPSYFSGKMDTTAAMDVSSSSKEAAEEAGTLPVSNSPRKRGVSPGKFGAFLGIASFETTPSSSTDKDNTSAMEVCSSSSSPTKSTVYASLPDSPSKFGAFLGLAPVAKMPPTAPPTAPIVPPTAPSSSSSSSSSSSAMAGSRAAQEALDRAMNSAKFTDTTGLESAIKMAKKKGVNTDAAEIKLQELCREKQRLISHDEEKEKERLGVGVGDDDGISMGPKVSLLRETFNSKPSVPGSSTASGGSISPAKARMPDEISVPGKRGVFSLFC